MSIQSVTLYKKDGGFELKKIKGFLVPRGNFTRSYEVYTDTPSTLHYDVFNHVDIPKLYSVHPEFPGCIAKKIRAPQGMDDEGRIFDVTVEYDDDFDGVDKDEPTDKNPLNRPTIIGGATNEHDEIVVRDVNGTLVRNTAKDYFDPPLMRKGGAFRFTMTKNYASLNLALLRQYKNAINSDVWFNQAAQTVRVANITFNRQIEDVQVNQESKITWVYWTHTFEFEVADPNLGDGTWRKYVPSRGFKRLSGGVLLQILDKGHPITTPAFLNSSGDVETNPANVYWQSFDVYRQLPFSALNLL